ncbi:flagellar basal-body rod protein FlgC [Candidatus Tenderia electrophaga]|jgi:flagellar basal-body rod protein FlgC|uniref:Flagellar basal-body rod protein FlgC n=1 Tax=Candidatus Tenderia electrophaga TaxID=1748243 RepID=A0A0S2TBV4_9GAMM|nr:flagellar basal-body rod protein FlgC [Candidatus Tenderia electrophaga]
MGLFNVFDVSGSAMNAQTVRLNTIASNLANAESISGNPDQVYKAKTPMFETLLQQESNQNSVGVKVKEILESQAAPVIRHDPNHPLADAEGNVYLPNIDTVQEMANMMSASRSYQNNVEVFNTSKQLLMRTINLGR